jgi:tetratricopeptide (TPR) repeat protein
MFSKQKHNIFIAVFLVGLFLFLGILPDFVLAQTQVQANIMEIVERGYLAQRRGEFDSAIEIYTNIIQRRGLTAKQRAVTYLLRGEAKREKGSLEEAIYDFTRALNQWQNYPQAIFFRGQALVQLNRLPEALIDLTRAVELDPDRESYHTSLSILKKKMQAEGLPVEVRNTTLEIKIPAEK